MVHRHSKIIMLLLVLVMIFISQSSEAAAEKGKGFLSYEGPDYTVSITYGPDAGIPETAILNVSEIYEGSKDYRKYYSQTETYIEQNTENQVSRVRFYDVTIYADNKEIEPDNSVEVSISYEKSLQKTKKEEVEVIHFVENGKQELLEITEEKENRNGLKEVAFRQDSFSVIGMIVLDGMNADIQDISSEIISGLETLKVEKEWSDGDQVHEGDSVTISLYECKNQEWVECDTRILNHENEWEGEFNGLDKQKEYRVRETKVTSVNTTAPATYRTEITDTSEKRWCAKTENQLLDDERILLVTGNNLIRKSSEDKEFNLRLTGITTQEAGNGETYCTSPIAMYELWISLWNEEQKAWEIYNPYGNSYLSLVYSEIREQYEWTTCRDKVEGSYLKFENGLFSATTGGVTKYLGNINGKGPYEGADEGSEAAAAVTIYHYRVTSPGICKITNIKNETMEEPAIEADVITEKTIDYLGDLTKNPDTDVLEKGLEEHILKDLYRLNLGMKMQTDFTGLDLLLVIDVSSSMRTNQDAKDEEGNLITRAEALRQALNQFVPQFLPENTKNRISIVAFEADAMILQKWTQDSEEILEKINYENEAEMFLYNGEGTNYEAALTRAHEAFASCGYSTNAKAMVFLSDGYPTVYLDGNDTPEAGDVTRYLGEARLCETGIEGTLPDEIRVCWRREGGKEVEGATDEAITSFQTHNPHIMTGTIAFNTEVSDRLKHLATAPKFVTKVENGTASDLIEAMELITIYEPQEIIITDELSKYVELYEAEPDFKITVTDQQGEETVLYTAEQGVTAKGKDILDETNPLEINGKKIIVRFRKDYTVENGNVFCVSFNINAAQEAYNLYADTKGIYPDKGDEGTDYRTNRTSSLKEGFYSNGKDTNVSYLMNGVKMTKKYKRPVIQVREGSLHIVKTDFQGNVLSEGADFELYRTAEEAEAEAVSFHGYENSFSKVGSGTTNEKGELSFEHLRLAVFDEGYPYYLVETKAPEGYGKITEILPLAIYENQVQVVQEMSELRTEDNELTVRNAEEMELSFVKFSSIEEKELHGAQFQWGILTCEKEHKHTDACSEWLHTVTSEPGFTISEVFTGNQYMLKETKAPEGYICPSGYWIVSVDHQKEITIENVGSVPGIILKEDGTYWIENRQALTLPVTGGSGGAMFLIIGIIMIVGGSVMILKQKISKIAVIGMLCMLVLQMFPTTAYAIGSSDTGKITVNDVEAGVNIYAYKLMDVTYDYGVDQPKNPMYTWVDEAADWVHENYANYIDAANENEVLEAFSQAKEEEVARLYDTLAAAIKKGDVTLEKTSLEAESDTVTIENLLMGNYFLLIEDGVKVYRPLTANVVPEWKNNTWTMSTPSVSAKATEPSITKTITKDLKKDNVDIGDTIGFEIIAVVPDYPENATAKRFAISDKMVKSLSLTTGSLKVYGQNAGKEDTLLTHGFTDMSTRPVEEGTVTWGLEFDYPAIQSYETVKITYEAVLNGSGIIGGTGNQNLAALDYNNNPYVTTSWNTDEDETTVYTYGLKISKVDEDNKTALSGAEFTVTKSKEAVRFVGENGIYRVALQGENGIEKVVTDKNGKLELKGLDADTYILEETKAPEGYVKLQKPMEITIADEDLDGKAESGNQEFENGYVPVTVENDKGFILPVTGGTGTILFNLVGAGMILAGAMMLLYCLCKKKEHR